MSGWFFSGDVIDERNSFLETVWTYTTGRTIDKDFIAKAGTYFTPGTIFPRDLVYQNSGINLNLNRSITRQEFANMLTHFLRIHGLDPALKDRLFAEIKFATPTYITRGETAYVLRRLMEPYKEIPIGNDYLLLKAIYDKVRTFTAADTITFLTLVQQALMRIPTDTLTNYGLTKYRLLSDIDALRTNIAPTRKDRVTTDMETLRRRRQDRRNVEAFIDKGILQFYRKDRYDAMEF